MFLFQCVYVSSFHAIQCEFVRMCLIVCKFFINLFFLFFNKHIYQLLFNFFLFFILTKLIYYITLCSVINVELYMSTKYTPDIAMINLLKKRRDFIKFYEIFFFCLLLLFVYFLYGLKSDFDIKIKTISNNCKSLLLLIKK